MPGLVNQERLKALVRENVIVKNGEGDSIEGVKYDFRIGPSFLKSKFRRAISFDQLQNIDAISSAEVEPGEVVFVMTEEEIHLPTNMMIVLTHKRKIAYDGVLILGGLAVDPGYEGPLLIGLYNFSSRPFPLTRYRKIIAGVFYLLSDEEAKDIKKFPAPSEVFPDDLVRLITNYQPVSLSGVTEKLTHLEGQLKILNDQFMTSREWQEKFENNLSKIQTETAKIQDETAKIASMLKEEVADRKADTRTIHDSLKRADEKISDVDKKNAVADERRSNNSKLLWAILAFLVGIVGYMIRDALIPANHPSPPPPITAPRP